MHHKTTVVGSGVPHHSAAANRDYRARQPGREAEKRSDPPGLCIQDRAGVGSVGDWPGVPGLPPLPHYSQALHQEEGTCPGKESFQNLLISFSKLFR